MRLLVESLTPRRFLFSFSPIPPRPLVVRGLELGDVELGHLQHPPHHLAGSLAVGIAQQLREHRRHDLPRDAVLVLEPAAWTRLSPLGERVPVVVDLVLVGARDRERHRLGEGELRPAVDGLEGLPVDLKLDEHHRGVGIRANVAEPIDMQRPWSP